MGSRSAAEADADTLVADGWTLLRALEQGDHDAFRLQYESWYTRALPFMREIASDRGRDFQGLYERPDAQKSMTVINFGLRDFLLEFKSLAYPDNASGALVRMRQQAAMVEAGRQRMDSALADLRGLVEADLLGSEAAAARELLRAGHLRAGGCLAGVVIERELASLAHSRGVAPAKKEPAIADWNDELKRAAVFDVVTWRRVQRLGDIRNLCCHAKEREPTLDEVEDLIRGAEWLGAEWTV